MQSKIVSQQRNDAHVPRFDWQDPFLLDSQLSEDERMIAATAKSFAEDVLAPGIIDANRNASRR